MPESELNDLERRLAGWRPAADGLDADAMLFAAGRASIRRGSSRFVWPAIAAALALALGISETVRTTERRDHEVALARLTDASRSPTVSAPWEASSPNYLIVRRAMEDNPDGMTGASRPPLHLPADQPTLRAGQRDLEFTN